MRAVDEALNVEPAPAERGFRVDVNSPETGFHSEPTGPISDDTPTFDWFVDDPRATVTCRIDEEPFRPCPSPATYGPLRDGRHTFQLKATDRAGNTSTTELVAILVDTRVAGPEVLLPRDQPEGAPTVVGKAHAKERTTARMRAVVKIDGAYGAPGSVCAEASGEPSASMQRGRFRDSLRHFRRGVEEMSTGIHAAT